MVRKIVYLLKPFKLDFVSKEYFNFDVSVMELIEFDGIVLHLF